MTSLHVELDLSPWRDGLRALRRGLDDALERAVRSVSRELRDEAKRSHAYRDRTTFLTRSIAALPTRGRFSDDTLEAGVIDTAPYASFVEEGTSRARAYAFLATAVELRATETQGALEDALEAAVRASGLS